MDIFFKVQHWRNQRKADRIEGLSLGMIPTMGALHRGHLSLIERSLRENDRTIVSIFVNPTQFDNPDDFSKYPIQVETDIETLRISGVHYLVLPDYEEIYPDNFRYQVIENEESHLLCGAHRPGHFNGVLTVVMKLLHLADAERAYFGEKDYQQLQLISDMVKAFFMNVEVIGCPTLREESGLAMSSRNQHLSPIQLEMASQFNQILRSAASSEEATNALRQVGFRIDYVEERWGRRLGAVHLGNVRLIDNVELK
jgi:pantoate--beta-alanine ligase